MQTFLPVVMRIGLIASAWFSLGVMPAGAQPAQSQAADGTEFELQQHEGGVRVLQAGELVADYLTLSKSKPIIYPLLGPDGVKMTRDYPMQPDSQGEAHDHPHHRSLWFTHGEVNGVDFWAENDPHGMIVHQEFTQLKAGRPAIIAARNIWKTADGKPVLSERSRFSFHGGPDLRWLDCDFALTAEFGDVHFGDTKEGSFGMRIAESMKIDAKRGGYCVNNLGDRDGEAWGKAAAWVDYVGPIGDKTYGVAMLCHPSSFHYPNRWHVRSYGLFAANPFGTYHFTGAEQPGDGVRLKQGESIQLRYRILMHRGDTHTAQVAQHFEQYAQQDIKDL